MNIQELVQSLHTDNPGKFEKIPENRLQSIVRALLDTIGTQIDQAADGELVKIPVLGAFRIKVQPAEDNEPAKRRVTFRRNLAKGQGKTSGK